MWKLSSTSLALCALAAFPLIAADTAASPNYDWRANALKHWQSSYAFTYQVVEAMPAEAFSYIPPSTAKPTERNYGGLTAHIGVFNIGMAALVSGMKGPEALPKGTTDKAQILAYLHASEEFLTKALKAATQEQLSRTVKFANIEETGYEAFEGAFAHMAHTRGQCEVYLRLQNILPPKYPFE
jgi:uncharacterized damage-inducible protein DinB